MLTVNILLCVFEFIKTYVVVYVVGTAMCRPISHLKHLHCHSGKPTVNQRCDLSTRRTGRIYLAVWHNEYARVLL